ncbi:MAG: glycoside hydrolase family 28 protein [Bacteroidota bacterium]
MMKTIVCILTLGLFLTTCTNRETTLEFTVETARTEQEEGWKKLDTILNRIKAPEFPDRTVTITEFGAINDSTKDSRMAIQQAIETVAGQGGGMVVIPKGDYLSNGPVHLRSNIHLKIEEGAYLKFGTNPEDYTPLVKVRWEGTMAYNYSPLIYGYEIENVAITGKGRVNGQALEFWSSWRAKQNPDKARLRQMGNDKVPVKERVFGDGFLDKNGDGNDDGFGDGEQHWLRPTLIELVHAKQVLIEGLRLEHSPFWTVHPVFCENVIIRGLDIYGDFLNDDGIDPDSCTDVLIEDNIIQTRDDAISIKAGRDQDAWDRPGSKNIVIRNNELISGVNAICIGSEMSGGVDSVFIYNNRISNGKHALNFKTNLDRGGQVQHIYMRDNYVESTREALFIFRMDYHGHRGNDFPTKFNNFYLSSLEAGEVGELFRIVGVEAEPIRNVFIEQVQVKSADSLGAIRFSSDVVFDDVTLGGKEISLSSFE